MTAKMTTKQFVKSHLDQNDFGGTAPVRVIPSTAKKFAMIVPTRSKKTIPAEDLKHLYEKMKCYNVQVSPQEGTLMSQMITDTSSTFDAYSLTLVDPGSAFSIPDYKLLYKTTGENNLVVRDPAASATSFASVVGRPNSITLVGGSFFKRAFKSVNEEVKVAMLFHFSWACLKLKTEYVQPDFDDEDTTVADYEDLKETAVILQQNVSHLTSSDRNEEGEGDSILEMRFLEAYNLAEAKYLSVENSLK